MIANARIWLTITAVALCVANAHAELVWERTEIELRPALGDETAVGHFKYQNKGDKAVAITNIATSCGCTAASTNKDGVAPGEKGEITATFQIGNRVGTQQKTITVTTDDPSRLATALQLKVEIPQILEVQPTFVFWQQGEAAEPKTIRAKPGKGISIKKLQVTSSSPEFTAKVESKKKEFEIQVTPRQTTTAAYASLTIKTDLPNAAGKTFSATARVMPPVAARDTAAKASPSPDQFDACSLLTSAEIEAVQGEPVTETKRSDNASVDTISQCYFLLSTPSNSINVTVVQRGTGPQARDPKQLWETIFHDEKREEKEEEEGEKSAAPERIADLGDEAFWLGNRVGGALMVLKGNAYFKISVGGTGDQAIKIKKSKELAEKVLKRL